MPSYGKTYHYPQTILLIQLAEWNRRPVTLESTPPRGFRPSPVTQTHSRTSNKPWLINGRGSLRLPGGKHKNRRENLSHFWSVTIHPRSTPSLIHPLIVHNSSIRSYLWHKPNKIFHHRTPRLNHEMRLCRNLSPKLPRTMCRLHLSRNQAHWTHCSQQTNQSPQLRYLPRRRDSRWVFLC